MMDQDYKKVIVTPFTITLKIFAKPDCSNILPLVNRTAKALSLIVGLMLCLPSSAYADEQRYISIRNTDTVWTPGNICSYQFRLV